MWLYEFFLIFNFLVTPAAAAAAGSPPVSLCFTQHKGDFPVLIATLSFPVVITHGPRVCSNERKMRAIWSPVVSVGLIVGPICSGFTVQEGRVKVAEKTPPSPPSRRTGLDPSTSCRERASANGSTSGWALDLSQWATGRGPPSTLLRMFSSTKWVNLLESLIVAMSCSVGPLFNVHAIEITKWWCQSCGSGAETGPQWGLSWSFSYFC